MFDFFVVKNFPEETKINIIMAHSSSHSERSIHEMLKDTPPMNESNSAIHSGIEGRVKHPNSLPFRNNSGKLRNIVITSSRSYYYHINNIYLIIFSLYRYQLHRHQQHLVHRSTVNRQHF